jgi:hypothetical protein
MMVKKSLEPAYDAFGKGLQTSVFITLNTSIDLDSTSIGTLCLDFDRVHQLQLKVDSQSGIRYSSWEPFRFMFALNG